MLWRGNTVSEEYYMICTLDSNIAGAIKGETITPVCDSHHSMHNAKESLINPRNLLVQEPILRKDFIRRKI